MRNKPSGIGTFLSSPSIRRATDRTRSKFLAVCTFLSSPSIRRATKSKLAGIAAGAFLSSPSIRRATAGRRTVCQVFPGFYPRPPYGGRRISLVLSTHITGVSILALHTEGDALMCVESVYRIPRFYPRPPYGGRPGRPSVSAS